MPDQKGKKLADALYGQPEEKAAFGVFPQMKPRRSKQDPEAAKDVPRQLLRGWAAGTLGLPGDIEGLIRMLPGLDETPRLPTSEFYLDYLPGKAEGESGKTAAAAGTLFGGLGSTKIARGALEAGKGAAKLAERAAAMPSPSGLAAQRGVVKLPESGSSINLDQLRAGGIEVPASGFTKEEKAKLRPLYNQGLIRVEERDGKQVLVPGKGAWYEFATPEQRSILDAFQESQGVRDLSLMRPTESLLTSAQSSFYDFEIVPGVRNVPIKNLEPFLPGYDSGKEAKRIEDLAGQIRESKQIEPLFIGLDPTGEAYIMEGQHRIRALKSLGYDEVPARIVVDMDDVAKAKGGKVSFSDNPDTMRLELAGGGAPKAIAQRLKTLREQLAERAAAAEAIQARDRKLPLEQIPEGSLTPEAIEAEIKRMREEKGMAAGGAVNMDEGGAAFGQYTTGRKYQKARERAQESGAAEVVEGALRGLFGLDPAEGAGSRGMEAYRNMAAASSSPTPLALAAIPAKGAKAIGEAIKSTKQKSGFKFPQEEALERARRNAVEMLGLPESNTAANRAAALGFMDYYHGTQRLDRILEGKGLDPKRATSGPMPYGTTERELASSYAMSKPDTSRRLGDAGEMQNYFQVNTKDLYPGGKSLISAEQAYNFLPFEKKTEILDKARRIGYQNPEEASGPFTLHPTPAGLPVAESHFDYMLNREAKGNPLTALRQLWAESGNLDPYAPSELADIYKIAGFDLPITQTNAPWTEAQGVLMGKARLTNPLKTNDIESIQNNVLPNLKEAFKNDRTQQKQGGVDSWDKNTRFTPKQWINQLEEDTATGANSFVWTSIPDKISKFLEKDLGYDGILDISGKKGGPEHPVVIPFQPKQVRSKFAAFDPAEIESKDMLKRVGGAVEKAAGGNIDKLTPRQMLYLSSSEDIAKLTPHQQREVVANMGSDELRQRMSGYFAKGGAVKKTKVSDNPDTMRLELMKAKG